MLQSPTATGPATQRAKRVASSAADDMEYRKMLKADSRHVVATSASVMYANAAQPFTEKGKAEDTALSGIIPCSMTKTHDQSKCQACDGDSHSVKPGLGRGIHSQLVEVCLGNALFKDCLVDVREELERLNHLLPVMVETMVDMPKCLNHLLPVMVETMVDTTKKPQPRPAFHEDDWLPGVVGDMVDSANGADHVNDLLPIMIQSMINTNSLPLSVDPEDGLLPVMGERVVDSMKNPLPRPVDVVDDVLPVIVESMVDSMKCPQQRSADHSNGLLPVMDEKMVRAMNNLVPQFLLDEVCNASSFSAHDAKELNVSAELCTEHPFSIVEQAKGIVATTSLNVVVPWPPPLAKHLYPVKTPAGQAELGRGKYGKVWLARTHLGNHLCAVKVTSTPRSANISEFSLPFAFPHHNLARMLRCLSVKDHFYTVQEYISGHTLEAIWKEKLENKWECLLENDVDEMLSQSLDALNHLAQHSIVHHDIKPSNIILSEYVPGVKLRLVLVDFGFCDQLAEGESVRCVGRALGGTPAYMAPEYAQICSRKSKDCCKGYNTQSDVWSLGRTFTQILSCVEPWHGNVRTKNEMLQQLRDMPEQLQQQAYDPLQVRCSQTQRDIIVAMLEPKAVDRPPPSIMHSMLEQRRSLFNTPLICMEITPADN